MIAAAIQKLRNTPEGRNFAWLLVERVSRLSVGVLVGGLVARHLGTSEFGVFIYLQALCQLFSALSGLSAEPVAVREIIVNPGVEREVVAALIGIRLAASTIGGAVTWMLVTSTYPTFPKIELCAGVLWIGMVIGSFEGADLTFQARCQMGRLTVPKLAVFCGTTIFRIALVLLNWGLLAVAAVTALEQALCALVPLIVLRGLVPGHASWLCIATRPRALIGRSWPLLFAYVAILLQSRSGILLLTKLSTPTAVGIFGAGTRFAEAALFVPAILAQSYLPKVLHAKGTNPDAYKSAQLNLFRKAAALSYAIAAPLAVLAPYMIRAVYGEQFRDATVVMIISSLSIPFIFLNFVRGHVLMNENMNLACMALAVVALVVNISLALWLIPSFGPPGAAFSFLAANAGNLLVPFAFRKLRRINATLLHAAFTPFKR